jgi:SAM-dependent methyltransferase
MFWLLMIADAVLILAALWIWTVIIKLFLNKEYRECPPYIPSFGKEKKVIIDMVGKILERSTIPMTILDPGCGTGSLIVQLAKKFPQHKFVGIEWGKLAYLIAKFKTKNLKNVILKQQDMFTYSFADANIIICFLMQPLMERFGNKVKQDAKKGLIVFSNSFYIPNIELSEKIETGKFLFIENVYVYKL